jgi:hypothetical protein
MLIGYRIGVPAYGWRKTELLDMLWVEACKVAKRVREAI